MIKFKCPVLLFILSVILVLGVQAAKAGNSCVRCHSVLSNKSFIGVKSHSWQGSIHQEHGIMCDKCHGGDPDAVTEKLAHIGVFSSSNPDSTVYYKNIPSTCGKCHGAEFYKFTQSYHYKKLESTGQGPNCVTCHGSMVTAVLTPSDMANVCDRCHNSRIGVLPYIPKEAKAVLLLLKQSRELINADRKLYTSKNDEKLLSAAQANMSSARLEWHTFDLDSIVNYLQEAYNSLEKLPAAQQTPAQEKPVLKKK